ncbi:hypothetical protein TOPH_03471 [Tolypocladium ophioglossoides CBS 100239]|uniref:Uncharacterized protein n=1 Tax=Tolypocladium ophioglossoides (strain CBS 100239) TaxID=1163406 RepID=A0A0L0NCY7_TOLOC|nr:hypothetical protein TOPH_03471 [Tolypocladium ophioglossoides CBS 100239]
MSFGHSQQGDWIKSQPHGTWKHVPYSQNYAAWSKETELGPPGNSTTFLPGSPHLHPADKRYAGSTGQKKRALATAAPVRKTWRTRSASSERDLTDDTGTCDSAFMRHLVDHGIYPPAYESPDGQPLLRTTWLRFKRACSSDALRYFKMPTGEYELFVEAEDLASLMWGEQISLLPIVGGHSESSNSSGQHVLFTNVDHLTDGSLAAARPGIYHGSPQEQINSRVLATSSTQIAHSPRRKHPIVPNFIIEAKGSYCSPESAERQLRHALALGTRRVQSLQPT